MPRYFLEVAYKGTQYSGFQIQKNANSVQAEIERALKTFFRQHLELTGSSRTDGGVHALQNFFHFDYEQPIDKKSLYNINAILPADIVIKNVEPVSPDAHCRFDAIAREYRYHIYHRKDPFLADRAWYFPYTLDRAKLDAAAAVIKEFDDFTAFSKRNTQVKSFICTVYESAWNDDNKGLVYRVKANRFLRGMVRGLVGTMLQVGRGKLSVEEFAGVLKAKDNQLADFSAPGHGLFLQQVFFPVSIYPSA